VTTTDGPQEEARAKPILGPLLYGLAMPEELGKPSALLNLVGQEGRFVRALVVQHTHLIFFRQLQLKTSVNPSAADRNCCTRFIRCHGEGVAATFALKKSYKNSAKTAKPNV